MTSSAGPYGPRAMDLRPVKLTISAARKTLSPDDGAGNGAPGRFRLRAIYRHAKLVDRHVVGTFDFLDQLGE